MRAHPTKDHTDPKHLFSQCRSKASTAYVATMAEFRPVITWIKRGPPGLGHMQMKKTWWHLIHVPKLQSPNVARLGSKSREQVVWGMGCVGVVGQALCCHVRWVVAVGCVGTSMVVE